MCNVQECKKYCCIDGCGLRLRDSLILTVISIAFSPHCEEYHLKILRSEELHVVTRGSKSPKPPTQLHW